MKRNPQYEAGFIRAVDDAEPEDLLAQEARAARTRMFMLAGIVVVIVCIGVGAAIASSGDSPAKQRELGRQLSARSDHRGAIMAFKRSLIDDPKQPAVRFMLAREYASLGDPKAAEIEFRKALELKFEPERTLPLLVASLVQQERFEKVIATVNNATLDSPAGNADLQAMLGSAYFELGREAEAGAAWKAATDLVPSHPGALLAEARALAAHGAFADASALLARIPPDSPLENELQETRGDIARATGKPIDAVASYEAAVKLDPGNLVMRTTLAQVYVDLERFDDAQRQIDTILAASPANAKAQYIGALAAVGRRDYRAADEAITRSVQGAPRDGKAQLMAGRIAFEMAHLDEAELHLREAVALMPKNPDAKRALADFYVGTHDAAKAEEVIGPLFTATPNDRQLADVAARVALLQGDPSRAAKAYDRVDPTSPENIGASLTAASLKFAAGDNAGGLDRLKVAGIADPANVDIDVALVSAYLQLHQPKEAANAWNAVVRKQPDQARTYEVLATVERARGDAFAARRALDKAIELEPRYFPAVAALARLDVDERLPDDAIDRLRRFIASNPAEPEATMQLVEIEKSRGGRDAAIVTALRDARKASPQSTRIIGALATWYLAHGDPQRALAAADEGLALQPNDVLLLQVAGDASVATGNASRATTIFKTLSAMNVQSGDYPVLLGGAWLTAGDPEAALTAFRLALRRQPERVDLHRTMVATLLRTGRPDEADRLLFEINRLAPKSTAIPELAADVKLARRKYPEAIAAYRRALEITPTSLLAIRTYEAMVKARQSAEADAFIASWLKTHPTDEAVRARSNAPLPGNASMSAR
ncbi:MAG: XrtA/PEP-CTERM system TPR-repeat protein PrsT [Burkholderiaceae bacterium]